MKRALVAAAAALSITASGLAITTAGLAIAAPQSKNANGAPRYVVDPFWPKDLPENWTLGQVAGIAVDNQDNVWIVHRPRTLVDDEKGAMKTPPETRCCKPAPAVLQFSPDGRLLKSWGGPGAGLRLAQAGARHPHRQGGQRLARRQRQGRSPDPEIRPRRQVPAADRQGGLHRRLQQQATSSAGRPTW